MRFRCVSIALMLALVCGGGLLASASVIQQGGHVPAEHQPKLAERLGTQPVTENHVELIRRVFDLDDAQQLDVWDAFDTLTEIESREADKRDAAIGEHILATEDDDDWGAADAGRERIEREHEERMREHRLAFYNDVRLFLDVEQERRWDTFLAELLLLEELPKSVYPGDHTDLRALVEELELPGRDKASAERWADAYTQGLIRELLERAGERHRATRKLSGDGSYTIEDIERTMAPARRSAWGVVRYNLDALESAKAVLPPASAQALASAFYESSYPHLVRDTFFDRALNGVGELDDLEPEQADTIDTLKAQHAKRRDPLVAKQLEAAFASSKARSTGRLESPSPFDAIEVDEPGQRRSPPPRSEREDSLFSRRIELERDSYLKLIKALRPEQIEALHERVPGLPMLMDRRRAGAARP